jgi:uncharacterized integral membrane protein
MKWWIAAAVGAAVGGALLAGQADIRRFRQIKRM